MVEGDKAMPVVTRGTIEAMCASMRKNGRESYLGMIADEFSGKNNLLFRFFNSYFSGTEEFTLREVYEAMLLTYKAIHNQIEADALEVGYCER